LDDSTDAGLFSITLFGSEDSSSPKSPPPRSRADKMARSEADFQALKAAYRPKVENGDPPVLTGEQDLESG